MTDQPFRVHTIDHVEIIVPDRGEAARWLETVLGLQVVLEYEHWAEDADGPLMVATAEGGTKLALFRGEPSSDEARSGFHRVAFRVDGAGFAQFLGRLAAVPVLAAGGRRVNVDDVVDHEQAFSIYFNDPWGHRYEVTTYDVDPVRRFLQANLLAEGVSEPAQPAADASPTPAAEDPLPRVIVYTDGGSLGNPGPGGYGVVLLHGGQRKELSGGFRHTTNNRMELMAAIVALEALRVPCAVTLYSDSRYLVDAVNLGWARRWRANDWRRNKRELALNPDLWARLLDLLDEHQVEFVWVKGHAGDPENERCDRLTQQAARRANLPADEVYEQGGA